MAIRVLLFEPEDILYKRPQPNQHFHAFLEKLGLQPRHPQMVQRALKAGYFDVIHGRITRDDFYDAILRFYEIEGETVIPIGRKALLADSMSIEAMNDAPSVLKNLQADGFKLALVMNSEHPSQDVITMLARAGFPTALWSSVTTSCQVGKSIPDKSIFDTALDKAEASPGETAFISPRGEILVRVMEYGLATVAFGQPENNAFADHCFQHLSELYQFLTK
ncbi:MAG: hypothetical protein GYB66_04440 [Chloroflexi bacterium]|nr:hypothetical protein [Chloroflexota bacterium]